MPTYWYILHRAKDLIDQEPASIGSWGERWREVGRGRRLMRGKQEGETESAVGGDTERAYGS